MIMAALRLSTNSTAFRGGIQLPSRSTPSDYNRLGTPPPPGADKTVGFVQSVLRRRMAAFGLIPS